MAKAKLHAADGTAKPEVELPASLFEQKINEPVMYSAVHVYLYNQRQGTTKTKGRSEVSGGGKKPWKQKGTGRARQGSNTAPNWARGGKAHGPQPHDYSMKLNKKTKRLALLSALTVKAQEGAVRVFESIGLNEPKTKALVGILAKAEIADAKNLILVSEPDMNLALAARNLPKTRIERVQDVNTYTLLNCENVIFTDSALKAIGSAQMAG
jgi:large subunit ribosomal protein L4